MQISARTTVVMSVISLIALPLFAKNKKVSNVFDAAPSQVYDAAYRFAQRHGTIKWADEKRFTLNGVIFVPGGKWDWQKNFDCTISVEPIEGGKKSVVDVVGSYPAKQQSLVGAFGEGPAVKVVRAIREEFDRAAATPTTATPLPAGSTQPEPVRVAPVAPARTPPVESNSVATPATTSPPQLVPAHAEPIRVTPAATVSISPRQPAAEVNGLVDVTFASNPPGALVLFSGMAFRSTPFVTKLQPGKYTIRMTLAGYPDWETEVTVDAGKPTTVVAQLNSTTGVVLK